MASIISIHSFRGGTGKSNTTANLAAVWAADGKRVGVIDADIQSPGIHVILGVEGDEVRASLNDYLWQGRALGDVAMDVTDRQPGDLAGRLFLIPSSMEPGKITQVLRQGYDAQRLTAGLKQLVDELALDVLLIDTHPGLNEETLLSLVISDSLLIVMRPDKQDYEGTAITARVAQELGVPRIMLLVNKAPDDVDPAAVSSRVERAYGQPVVAVLPHSDELMRLASEGIFVLRQPTHALSDSYRSVAAALFNGAA